MLRNRQLHVVNSKTGKHVVCIKIIVFTVTLCNLPPYYANVTDYDPCTERNLFIETEHTTFYIKKIRYSNE